MKIFSPINKKIFSLFSLIIVFPSCLSFSQTSTHLNTPPLSVDWNKTIFISKSYPSLLVVGNPMLLKGSPIHQSAFNALRNLEADYVRYLAWHPYPKLAVAELSPPDDKKTYWDFTLIDPIVADFMEATKGHHAILNFSTIPQWMFKTDKLVTYPDNANEVTWEYGGGNELRDTTFKEVTDYYTRIFSWYTKGGFTDELGKFHKSNHHYSIPYWEVLNEPELEHYLKPEQYTKLYDAIVSALKRISPDTKFIGMASTNYSHPRFFEYFLNDSNHKPGVKADAIAYHFYASAHPKISPEDYQYVLFEKSNNFLNYVQFIENIRKRVSPETKTHMGELGTFVNEEMRNKVIFPEYWNLSASVYAFLYIGLVKIGIDVITESQLVGFPSQYPDVSVINWTNGKPNARYWVLKMITDNFKPGDSLVETSYFSMAEVDYAAQAFITTKGKKVLVLNKRNETIKIKVPADFKGAKLNTVDMSSGESESQESILDSAMLTLKPFAVTVVSLK